MSDELYEEEIGLLRAQNAALRERLAAVEKAFADAERDRMADIQAAVRQDRARVDAEFARLRANLLAQRNFPNEKGYADPFNDGIALSVKLIDAARERLGGRA